MWLVLVWLFALTTNAPVTAVPMPFVLLAAPPIPGRLLPILHIAAELETRQQSRRVLVVSDGPRPPWGELASLEYLDGSSEDDGSLLERFGVASKDIPDVIVADPLAVHAQALAQALGAALIVNRPSGPASPIWDPQAAAVLQNTPLGFQPVSTVPGNVFFVGSLAPKAWLAGADSEPPPPLPAPLLQWLDAGCDNADCKAPIPVCVVAFGTGLDLMDAGDVVPLLEGLLGAGARVLWRAGDPAGLAAVLRSEGIQEDSAFRVEPWLPSMPAALRHPAVVLRVSQCSATVALENSLADVATLCLPSSDNDWSAAHAVHSLGSGTYLDPHSDAKVAGAVQVVVNHLLANLSLYRVAAGRLRVLCDLAGGVKRAADLVEVVNDQGRGVFQAAAGPELLAKPTVRQALLAVFVCAVVGVCSWSMLKPRKHSKRDE